MDITLVKFLIMWIMHNNIWTTRGVPLEETGGANIRAERSLADSIPRFGFNLRPPLPGSSAITRAKGSLSSLGNYFVPASISYHRRNNKDKQQHPIFYTDTVKNTKTTTNESMNRSPAINDSYNNNKPIIISKHSVPNNEEDMSILENNMFTNKEDLENKPKSENKTIVKVNDSDLEVVDEKLLEYIFQVATENYIETDSTTVDSTTDYTTESGNYETTTTDDLLRLAAPVVASLLG